MVTMLLPDMMMVMKMVMIMVRLPMAMSTIKRNGYDQNSALICQGEGPR